MKLSPNRHPVCPHCGAVQFKAPKELIDAFELMSSGPIVHKAFQLLLLRFGRWTPTERFIEELWEPSREPKDPICNVHLAIARLRKLIPPDWIINQSRGIGYRLEKILEKINA